MYMYSFLPLRVHIFASFFSLSLSFFFSLAFPSFFLFPSLSLFLSPPSHALSLSQTIMSNHSRSLLLLIRSLSRSLLTSCLTSLSQTYFLIWRLTPSHLTHPMCCERVANVSIDTLHHTHHTSSINVSLSLSLSLSLLLLLVVVVLLLLLFADTLLQSAIDTHEHTHTPTHPHNHTSVADILLQSAIDTVRNETNSISEPG